MSDDPQGTEVTMQNVIYYANSLDGLVFRLRGGQYEVLLPDGQWREFEPGFECMLHSEQLPESARQLRASQVRSLPDSSGLGRIGDLGESPANSGDLP